jgi:hypothetical protein
MMQTGKWLCLPHPKNLSKISATSARVLTMNQSRITANEDNEDIILVVVVVHGYDHEQRPECAEETSLEWT